MQSANEIRRHIAAVGQTRKITGAMEMISSARLQKLLKRIAYNDDYLSRVRSAMKDILSSPHPVNHVYLNTGTGRKRLYIVISADKGMCGTYNSNVLNYAYSEIAGCGESVMLFTVGLTASEFFRRRGIEPDIELPGMTQDPTLRGARRLTQMVMNLYDRHEARSVYAVYTGFNHTLSSRPTVQRILPIRVHDYEGETLNEPEHEILYTPSANEVFARLVPQYLVGLLFAALVQSCAGEHFARRNAMHEATRNADELITRLKLQYNTARQAAITEEIAEISGAAEVFRDKEEANG